MLLMVENRIRGGICQATYKYAKGNNKYMLKETINIWMIIIKTLNRHI